MYFSLINLLRKKLLNFGLFICFLFSPVSLYAVENADLETIEAASSIESLMSQEKNTSNPIVVWTIDHWIILIATTAFLFILMLLFFTFQLGRLVKKRTEDLAESEQHWRDLINAEPACVKTLNREGKLLSMNQAGLTMIDADNFEQLDGVNISNLIDEEYRENFRQLNENVFSGLHGDLLFKVKSLKGRETWLETHAAPFYDAKGNITRCLGVTKDVTRRINNENERQLLQSKLQSSQKMEALGLLTGGIAHDFNNLLGIIIGYTSLALSRNAPNEEEKLPAYLKNIQDAGERAKALVEQMLAFSRNDAIKAEPIQLYPWIEKDLELLRSALPSSIKIVSDLQEGLPAVTLSPVHLNQILMNLSINARDAMNEQGLLSFRLKMTSKSHQHCDACHKSIEGDWVELSITDTGTGIEPEIAKNMFDPFFTTKGVGKGNGMGLAVIYGIAHNNGGHILVESEKGTGTTFRILLPISSTGEKRNNEPDTSDEIVSIGNDEHILIVDDEPALAALLGRLLNKNGYRTTVTSNSIEALNLFNMHTNEYSLLITDQTMPDMTGIELTQKVREFRPNLPVIISSGYSEKLDEFMTTAINVQLLEKPFDTNRFLKLVHDTTKKNHGEIANISQTVTRQ